MDAALLVESAATGSARILPRAARTVVNATLGSTMRSVAPTIAANSSRKSNSGAAPNKVDSIGMETILGPIGGATHRSHRDAQWHRYRAVVHVQTHRSRRGSAGMFLAGQPGQAPAERAMSPRNLAGLPGARHDASSLRSIFRRARRQAGDHQE